MKKLIIVLICGFLLAPLAAWGQKWIEPYTEKDGTQVEGHWQTPEDVRKDKYSTPGTVNPYTGQFTPYTGSFKGPQSVTPAPANQIPMDQNPYYSLPDYSFKGPQSVTPAPANPAPMNQNPYYPQPDYRYKGQ